MAHTSSFFHLPSVSMVPVPLSPLKSHHQVALLNQVPVPIFYCARYGYATLALSKGMPIESVSRVLGHTNIVTTQIYAKITTEKLNNDLTMFGNKINDSFNNIKIA